jgi:hypothetical protein
MRGRCLGLRSGRRIGDHWALGVGVVSGCGGRLRWDGLCGVWFERQAVGKAEDKVVAC